MYSKRWLRTSICAVLVGGALIAGSPVLERVGIQARALGAALATAPERLSPVAMLPEGSGTHVVLGALAMLQLIGVVAFEAWAFSSPRRRPDGQGDQTPDTFARSQPL